MPTKSALDVYQEFLTANSWFVVAASMLLVLVLWVSYRRHHTRFLKLWTGCWVSYLLARLVTILQLGPLQPILPEPVMLGLSITGQTGFYMHVVLLFGCMLALLERGQWLLTWKYFWLSLTMVMVLCATVAVATIDSAVMVRLTWRVGVRTAATAVAFLICGVLLLRHGWRIRRFGAQFAGIALILNSVHLAVHALAFSYGGLYSLAAVMQGLEILGVCTIGFGLLLWVHEDAAEEARTAGAELAERTQELLRAQRLESVGQLAGGVAHDFNNVLTVVICNTEVMLAEGGLDDASATLLEQTKNAAMNAAKMTGQLLALARNPASALRAIDVGNEVREAMPLLRALAGVGVKIELKVEPGSLRARLKHGHIEQVLINLVTNARDAIADSGTISLSVARQFDERGARVVLQAKDTGEGMSDSVRLRVGELFFTTKSGKGTGMGMASVRSILSETNGLLEIQPGHGCGTVVTVSWPQAESITESHVEQEPPAAQRVGSATILLAEDDEVVRGIACRALSRAGFDVLVGVTSPDVARIAREHQGEIDLLVSDVVMPELSGPELAAEVRKARPEIGACFVSGFVDEESRAQLPASVPVLGKPFTPQELVDFVNQVLAARGGEEHDRSGRAGG